MCLPLLHCVVLEYIRYLHEVMVQRFSDLWSNINRKILGTKEEKQSEYFGKVQCKLLDVFFPAPPALMGRIVGLQLL